MSQYKFEFNYYEPRWGDIEMSLEDSIDDLEKKDAALAEIQEEFPEAVDIEITGMTKIG